MKSRESCPPIRDKRHEPCTWLLVEPRAGDRVEDNLNPVGASTTPGPRCCTPNALSQGGRLALGAQAGEARLREVVTEGGFSRFRRATETPVNLVLEGRMGAMLCDDLVYVEAGELAFKPRDQRHTFWNAGDEPCRVLEIIAPAGFEHFFREWDAGAKDGTLDPDALGARYGIEFDMTSVARICAEHGLVHPLLG